MTHSELIKSLGTAAIADRLNVPRAHVRVWKGRGIPRWAYAYLIERFPGVTLTELEAGSPVKADA